MRTKIVDIYNKYLKLINPKRKKDNNYYRPSSAGMCSRKIYYESIEKAEATNPIADKTRRIFRIGELIHKDIQESFGNLYLFKKDEK